SHSESWWHPGSSSSPIAHEPAATARARGRKSSGRTARAQQSRARNASRRGFGAVRTTRWYRRGVDRVQRQRRAALPLALVIAVSAAACGGSSTASVGAILGRDNETHALHVRDVPPGLAADKAGLRPGDEVLMIDGFFVKD